MDLSSTEFVEATKKKKKEYYKNGLETWRNRETDLIKDV